MFIDKYYLLLFETWYAVTVILSTTGNNLVC